VLSEESVETVDSRFNEGYYKVMYTSTMDN